MRRPLIAGNWKMHKTPSEALTWVGSFLERLSANPPEGIDVALAVPATHVAGLAARARGSGVAIAGQDLSAFDEGAYTGEVSGAMLADAGASHVVIGHSERRAYHHEDDALVAAKLRAARRHGLVGIVCVGESEEQRDAGDAESVVLRQLRAAIADLEIDSAHDLVVAYEPVWAIGTGRTATADDAQAMSAAIRSELRSLVPAHADALRILYGGSMKPSNAADLLVRPDIDGGLVGGASLDLDAFTAIVGAAR